MIPAGVERIIWAIAPSAALRDAMLGDFREEYELRRQREGAASARARVWFWPALTLLAPIGSVAGAVLQQAQAHRLAWEVTAQG